MGDGLTSPIIHTYSEQFNEAFPYYLSIGMTYEQFWLEDCYLAKFYREADKLSARRKNQELWLQGMYIYEGFSAVLSNAFAKKGSKREKYPEKPYDIDVPDTVDDADAKEKAKSDAIRIKLEAWSAKVNAGFQKREGVTSDGGDN